MLGLSLVLYVQRLRLVPASPLLQQFLPCLYKPNVASYLPNPMPMLLGRPEPTKNQQILLVFAHPHHQSVGD